MIKYCEICENVIQEGEQYQGNEEEGYIHIECIDDFNDYAGINIRGD